MVQPDVNKLHAKNNGSIHEGIIIQMHIYCVISAFRVLL